MHQRGDRQGDALRVPCGQCLALQSLIEAMSLYERLEPIEYIESTLESEPIESTDEQKAMIRSRAAVRRGPAVAVIGELPWR